MIHKEKLQVTPEQSLKKNLSKKMVCMSLFALLSLNNGWNIVAQDKQSSSQKETTAYNYQKAVKTRISELPNEVIKKVMLQKLNEIRASYKIAPLKYDSTLDSLGYQFATEKNGSERWTDVYMHFDKENLWIIDRAKKANIRPRISKHVVNKEVMWLGECLVSTNGNVEELLWALMKSPWHKRWLLCPYVTKVGFWYDKWYNILVQIFADIK